MKRFAIHIIALTLLAGCSHNTKHTVSEATDLLPAEPNYSDTTQWYIADRGAGVDVFYIVSTECADYTHDGQTYHYADTRSDSLRAPIRGEMEWVDRQIAGKLNYFSPYYRQCTLETFTADSLVEARMPLAYGDVRKAFAYYMEHYNGGRPFVLAGFSQGAMAVVDLLNTMDDDTYRRLVAAYVIGYKVTEQHSHIVAARDSADLGATVCYNSVRDNSCALPLLSEGNRIAINPAGWCTDATPVPFVDPRYGDTLTITLDTTSLLLHLDGYQRDDYMLPLIGRDGNYHHLDLILYADCLRRNIALRAQRALNREH